MPRLVGKRSNHGFFWGLVVVLAAIASLGTLEVKGYTDWVPEIGTQRQSLADGFNDF